MTAHTHTHTHDNELYTTQLKFKKEEHCPEANTKLKKFLKTIMQVFALSVKKKK